MHKETTYKETMHKETTQIDSTLLLRNYEPTDLDEMLALFYDTVHTVNRSDYTKAQADAWAPADPDRARWEDSLKSHYGLVALSGDQIVGFGDYEPGGHLDRLYVHRLYQGRGVATAIADALEAYAGEQGDEVMTVEASLTARPFFEKRGYRVIQEQKVERQGQLLTNFQMIKQL